jgi:hypothetical protein
MSTERQLTLKRNRLRTARVERDHAWQMGDEMRVASLDEEIEQLEAAIAALEGLS